MRSFFIRLYTQLRDLWKKWSGVQKLIFCAIIVVAVVGSIFVLRIGGAPQEVALFSRPITNTEDLDLIAARLDREQATYTITSDQRILVDSLQTARKLRTILASEDLIPGNTDPWDLFDIERWTQTDFERNINFRRALTRQIEQHIEALDDVDAANVTLVLPEVELFSEDQNPVTASIILSIKPGSDIRENKGKIEGIQKLVQFAVEGLGSDSITISDKNGVILNDFADFDTLDRVELVRRELQLKQEVGQQYVTSIYRALAHIYGEDRVEIINIDVTVDTGTRTQETAEFFPIETVPDNPNTPFSEREFVLAIPRSTEIIDESFEGSGFNPQGPPGQEGQTPPIYQDIDNLVGRYNNEQERINNEINQKTTIEEKRPEITRITAAVAIDGVWRWQYDENGRIIENTDGSISREYTPVDTRELGDAQLLVQDAVGYNPTRGDSVTVRHIQFDRTSEFEQEDQMHRRRQLLTSLVIYALIALVALVVLFIVIRTINTIIRKRRIARAEEIARQEQRLAESLASSDSGELDSAALVTSDALNQATEIARDYPQEVAQLLRVWISGD